MLKSNVQPNTRYRIVSIDLAVPAAATPFDIAQRIDELLCPGVTTGVIADCRYPCLNLARFPKTQVITAAPDPTNPGIFATADALKEITSPKSHASSIKERFNRREISAADAIKELARTFPTLARHGYFAPNAIWDAETVDRQFGHCSGAIHAVRFILEVWNPATKWAMGPFNLHDALGNWDPAHREAFLAWANDPWWP